MALSSFFSNYGAAIGGGLNFLGQLRANSQNSAQAQRSMTFSRDMARNAHQYEVEDLKKAGLNPILSGTGGKGASAQGGAQAKMENTANSAMTARLMNAQIGNINSQTALNQAGVLARIGGTNLTDKLGQSSTYVGAAAAVGAGAASAIGLKRKLKTLPSRQPSAGSKRLKNIKAADQAANNVAIYSINSKGEYNEKSK